MKENKLQQDIFLQFEKSIKDFSNKTNALSYKKEPVYNKKEDLKYERIYLEYENYNLIFQFTIQYSFMQYHHLLSAYIQFQDLIIPFHICITHYQIKTLDCFIIPCISNAHLMELSVNKLTENILKHLPTILQRHDGSIDPQYRQHVSLNMGLEEITKQDHEFFIELLYLQEVDQAYIAYLLEDKKKALKQYKKAKTLTTYQYMLSQTLNETKEYHHNFDQEYFNQLKLYRTGTLKLDNKEFLCLFISWMIYAILFAFFYTLLYLVFDFMLSRGSFYVLKEDPFFLFLPSYISSIAYSYFSRKKIYKLLYKKTYEKRLEIDDMENSPQTTRFMQKFYIFIVILSLLFVFLLTNNQIVFYDNGFVDRSDFFDIIGTYYRYEDIKEITYYKTQENGFKEIINEGTYVIELEINH